MKLRTTLLASVYPVAFANEGTEIHSGPVAARLVWGHPMKSQQKKSQEPATKGQLILRDGKPIDQWAFGLAFPKDAFAAHIWPSMAAEAQRGYPNGIPQRFSWKYVDGDTVDSKGVPYANREGYAGCIVLTVSTEYECPKVFKRVNGAFVQCTADEIKTGDYFALALNMKVNVAVGQNTPSIYVNPRAIEFVGAGTLIVSSGSVDPNTALGGATVALPPGATAPGAAPMVQPGPGMPGTTPMPGMMPAPAAMAPPPAAAGPTRPTDLTHVQMTPQGEMWWNGAAWAEAPVAAAPVAPPPPPPAPMAAPTPARPTDPTHIQRDAAGAEHWWNGTAWTPAPQLPPPAVGFPMGVPPAPGAAPMPGMMPMPGR